MKNTITMTESEVKNIIRKHVQENIDEALFNGVKLVNSGDTNASGSTNTDELIKNIEQKYPNVNGSTEFLRLKQKKPFSFANLFNELTDLGVDAQSIRLIFQSSQKRGGNPFTARRTARINRKINNYAANQTTNQEGTPENKELPIAKGGRQDIAQLQQALVNGGYLKDNHGPQQNGIDGFAGRNTMAAVNQAMQAGALQGDQLKLAQQLIAYQQRVAQQRAAQQRAAQNPQMSVQQLTQMADSMGYDIVKKQPNDRFSQNLEDRIANMYSGMGKTEAEATAELNKNRYSFGNNNIMNAYVSRGVTNEGKIRNEIRKTIKEMLNKQ